MKKIRIFLTFLMAACLFLVSEANALTSQNVTLTQPNLCRTYKSNNAADFAGEASIVYFYMGDSYLTTLAQETIELSKPFAKADYKVLLYDDEATFASKISSAKALAQADEALLPTRDNFFAAIRDAVEQGYVLNIWIIAHGTDYAQGEEAWFSSLDGGITSEDLREEFGGGCEQLPIRMVYTVACYHSVMNATWTALGAKAAAGARFINFYPTQFGKFTSEWNAGKSFSTALANSNTEASRTLVQAYVGLLGLQYSNKGECGLIPDVLGRTDCAEWFFTGGGPYDLGSDYDPSRSGKGNMNYASQKIVAGSGSLTRATALSWKMR